MFPPKVSWWLFVGTISLFEGLVTMKCSSSIFFNLSVAGFTLLNVSAKLTKSWWIDSSPCWPKKPKGNVHFLVKGTTWSSNMSIFGRKVDVGKQHLKYTINFWMSWSKKKLKGNTMYYCQVSYDLCSYEPNLSNCR